MLNLFMLLYTLNIFWDMASQAYGQNMGYQQHYAQPAADTSAWQGLQDGEVRTKQKNVPWTLLNVPLMFPERSTFLLAFLCVRYDSSSLLTLLYSFRMDALLFRAGTHILLQQPNGRVAVGKARRLSLNRSLALPKGEDQSNSAFENAWYIFVSGSGGSHGGKKNGTNTTATPSGLT
jgi:hypothetical protein